jgi:hypothetical protein
MSHAWLVQVAIGTSTFNVGMCVAVLIAMGVWSMTVF